MTDSTLNTINTTTPMADPVAALTPGCGSIVQRALGPDFDRLHPRIREQYDIASASNAAFVGNGIMESIWHGRWYIVPFLHIGSWRRILFPETGHEVPFEIRNHAYLDRFGRETVTWKRTFQFPARQREFDEYFIFSEQRGRPVLYAGTHQHLAVDLHFTVEENGDLTVRTEGQRLFIGPLTIPFPRFFSGDAMVRETFNETLGRFEVIVSIENPFWGKVLGYRGWFDLERITCTAEDLPEGVRPIRERDRE